MALVISESENDKTMSGQLHTTRITRAEIGKGQPEVYLLSCDDCAKLNGWTFTESAAKVIAQEHQDKAGYANA